MSRSRKRCLRCLLTVLLMVSIMSLPASGAVKYVPKGYVTTEPGYWMTEQDGRDLLTSVRTYRQERDIWHQTVLDMRAETDVRLLELKAELNEERNGWEGQIRQERKNTVLWSVGALAVGVIIGRSH